MVEVAEILTSSLGMANGKPQDNFSIELETSLISSSPIFVYNRFDFHGQCDMVMLDAPEFDNGKGLLVHVRKFCTLYRAAVLVSIIVWCVATDI